QGESPLAARRDGGRTPRLGAGTRLRAARLTRRRIARHLSDGRPDIRRDERRPGTSGGIRRDTCADRQRFARKPAGPGVTWPEHRNYTVVVWHFRVQGGGARALRRPP